MIQQDSHTVSASTCSRPDPSLSGVKLVELNPEEPLKDYLEAMELAKKEAAQHLEEFMMMSWYDRDRDVESPPSMPLRVMKSVLCQGMWNMASTMVPVSR